MGDLLTFYNQRAIIYKTKKQIEMKKILILLASLILGISVIIIVFIKTPDFIVSRMIDDRLESSNELIIEITKSNLLLMMDVTSTRLAFHYYASLESPSEEKDSLVREFTAAFDSLDTLSIRLERDRDEITVCMESLEPWYFNKFEILKNDLDLYHILSAVLEVKALKYKEDLEVTKEFVKNDLYPLSERL